MKRHLLIGLITLIAFTFVCSAQESGFRIGVGAAINPFTTPDGSVGAEGNILVPVQTTAFFIPMQIGDMFRIEPQFGLLGLSNKTETTTKTLKQNGVKLDTVSVNSTSENSRSGSMIGTGLFYTFAPVSGTRMYVGPRVGMLMTSSSNKTSSSDTAVKATETTYKQSDFFIGGAFGGEYYLSKYLSLGAEIEFTYISFGEPDKTVKPEPTATIFTPTKTYTQSQYATNALIFVRFFLNE